MFLILIQIAGSICQIINEIITKIDSDFSVKTAYGQRRDRFWRIRLLIIKHLEQIVLKSELKTGT